MSNDNFANRMISTNRNIRQRCLLKYSKHRKLNWEKWTEYHCIFSSSIDSTGVQTNLLELHDEKNVHERNGKIIRLQQLQSLTCLHGNPEKDEPKDIIILKIDGKRHRLGFDNSQDYNQWKAMLDGVFNSNAEQTHQKRSEDSVTVNLLYESVTALRYRVRFADSTTRDNLSLPDHPCDLIFDTDKLVLEQHQDKQYTFPRSTIRTLSKRASNEIQFELGTRAPVQGVICFRFDSPMDAQACFSQWNGDTAVEEIPSRPTRERLSVREQLEPKEEIPVPPPRKPLQRQNSQQPPLAPPRNISTRNPYYNAVSSQSSSSTAASGKSIPTVNTYGPFQERV